MKLAVDTNYLIRYLVADDQEQASIAKAAIEQAQRLVLPTTVLCETVWVLSQRYKVEKDDIKAVVTQWLQSASIECDKDAVSMGMAFMDHGGDFSDGVIAAQAIASGADEFTTFDKKCRKLIRKICPEIRCSN